MKLGFTLPELLIVMGIVAILTTLATVNLLRPQHQASTQAALATLMADLRLHQLKAMLGDTEDSANFSITLEPPLQVSTTFPNNQIVFQAGSGEVAGPNTIIITNPNGPTTTTLTVNRYGTIESVD